MGLVFEQILTDGVRCQVDKKEGRAENEDEEPDSNKNPHVDITNAFDSFFQTDIDSGAKNESQHADDQIHSTVAEHDSILVFKAG